MLYISKDMMFHKGVFLIIIIIIWLCVTRGEN